MNESTPKQQIVDRIKNATNILVTVSTNPTVDELSAAIGLTLMLNKIDKHATAVFSGKIPPAISFLDPSKTLENTVDSLRDFIIALDKEKADRLRYRVEDDVVRIFITPYRTKITQDDLEFTHGDFNVELVLALGVENQETLDSAIVAHGKILHDATVATLSAQNKKSQLGSIDWQDMQASSLCEMLVAISESIKGDKPILDEQIATALLTGIVSATNRFSNNQTSPKAMTMAAQLMAAGANQQLIAARLEEGSDISAPPVEAPVDGVVQLEENTSQEIRNQEETQPKEEKGDDLGEMSISHENDDSLPQPTKLHAAEEPETLPQVPSASIEEHDKRNKQIAGEEALDAALSKLGDAPEPTSSLAAELEAATEEDATITNDLSSDPYTAINVATAEAQEQRQDEPSNGRTLPLLSGREDPALPMSEHDPNSGISVSTKAQTIQPLSHTMAEIEDKVKNDTLPSLPPVNSLDSARQHIDSLFDNEPQILPAPDVVQAAYEPPVALPSTQPVQQPTSMLPLPPPLPDFSTLPSLPPLGDNNEFSFDTNLPIPVTPAPAPVANDPTQFRIPGQ